MIWTRTRALATLLSVVLVLVATDAGAGRCYICLVDFASGCWECLHGTDHGATGCRHVSCGGCSLSGDCGGLRPGCFVAGVRIATPEGEVPIEDLRSGALVVSRGPDGTICTAMVTARHVYETWTSYRIDDRLEVTGSHPFLVDGEWIRVEDLGVGDELIGQDGRRFPVRTIEMVHAGKRVYNISVAGTETYFAGGVLVHNKPERFIPGLH